jgi:CRISPR-associated protein Csd2
MLKNKYDFKVILSVKNANPNGDPLSENRPRINFDGYGEISDVCIKRKIRNRWMEMGESVFVQSNENKMDDYSSLKERAEKVLGTETLKNPDLLYEKGCNKWIDVRGFGQVFAYKGKEKDLGVSVGVRGPISVQSAFSLDPITIESTQITKSVNSEGDGTKKSSDTMGMKHRVSFGIYTFAGSISPQLAEKTGFDDSDASKLKAALITLFLGDASSARPDGTMEIVKVYWWKHNNKSGQYSSAKVHRSVSLALKPGISFPKSIEDYEIQENLFPDLNIEILEG